MFKLTEFWHFDFRKVIDSKSTECNSRKDFSLFLNLQKHSVDDFDLILILQSRLAVYLSLRTRSKQTIFQITNFWFLVTLQSGIFICFSPFKGC